MAEAVFRHLVTSEGLEDKFHIDSAGTGGWHSGEPPHHGTQKILNKYGISWRGQTARKFEISDFERFSLIIPMDRDNYEEIVQLSKKIKTPLPEIRLMLSYHPTASKTVIDVPDPYYTGNFEYVYELINDSCIELLQGIRNENI